jgi:predicted membrane channel-forming protein YqfA (hemolysin III family)
VKNTEYSRLVDEFTAKWKTSPKDFQRSIDVFAWLGVSVLVLAFVIGVLFILSLKIWLVIVGGIILYSIGRSVFYRTNQMPGIRLNQKDAPRLFSDVEEITRKLGALRATVFT